MKFINFLKKIFLGIILTSSITYSATVIEHRVTNGLDLINLFDKYSNDVRDINKTLPSEVKIKLSGTVILDTKPAIFSSYTDGNGKCRSVDFTITSEDPNNPAVLDGNSHNALFAIFGCGVTNITLQNVIFQNSYGYQSSNGLAGSIILDTEKGTVIVENSKFLNNIEHPTFGYEGGLRINANQGKVIVRKNIFFQNASSYNGAIYITSYNVKLENNLFTRNTASSQTSGVINISIPTDINTGEAYIYNNTIYGNFGSTTTNNSTGKEEATLGVGLNVGVDKTGNKDSYLYIYNNIIYNNGVNTDRLAGYYKGLQVYISNSSQNNKRNFVYLYNNNIGIDKGLFQYYGKDLTLDFTSGKSEQLWIEDTSQVLNVPLYEAKGNITDNPKLTNPFSLDSQTPVTYTDYNGYKLTSNSPLIDEGYTNSTLPMAATDIDGDNRPIDGNNDNKADYDIGFDEYTPQNSGNNGGSGNGSGSGGGQTYSTITLNITKPMNGTIKEGSNINCGTAGNNCSKDYATGTQITLEAVADNGYKFENWDNECALLCNGTDNPCTLTLPNDTNILNCTAVFSSSTKNQFNLQINIVGNGKVHITGAINQSCSDNNSGCTYTLGNGANITLKAVPDNGYKFKQWNGDCSNCQNDTCQLTIQGNTGCEAVFQQETNTNNGNQNDNATNNNGQDSSSGGGCSFGAVPSLQMIALLYLIIAIRKLKNKLL